MVNNTAVLKKGHELVGHSVEIIFDMLFIQVRQRQPEADFLMHAT